MSTSGVSRGELFSRMYLEKGIPTSDSKRFRARLAAEVSNTYFDRAATAHLILRELGVKVPSSGHTRVVYGFDSFLQNSEIRDVLDSITLIYRSIHGQNIDDKRLNFIKFVNRAMLEEQLSYSIDEFGSVHFYVDAEFERSRVSVVVGLSGANLQAAREAFEDSHKALLAADTLSAVRRSFDAVENVFKQKFSVSRLGASEIRNKLCPLLSASFAGRVGDACARLAASFAEWTNAAHQFRHAPGEADPSPPPLEMAILMVSEAAAQLRWLLSLPNQPE